MDASDVINPTPEERELSRMLLELTGLEELLAERELRLNSLEVELHVFEVQYLEVVGKRYAELDALLAEIADLESTHDPHSEELRARAEEAWERAQESADAVEASRSHIPTPKRTPTESLRKLFRQVARLIHPDLAEDEQSRSRREVLMSAVNRAYNDGDEDRLAALLREWEESPEAVTGHGTSSELLRAIRRIAHVRERIESIERECQTLGNCDLLQLRTQVEVADSVGRDLLAEMAAALEPQLVAARSRLAQLEALEFQP